MWHTFLVFTEEYHRCCKTYFGQFLHHIPRTHAQKRALMNPTAEQLALVRERMAASIKTVWDYLGEDVALRWYETHPERYSLAFFDQRRPFGALTDTAG